MACSLDFHSPVELNRNEAQALSHDVVFVGSYYPNRAKLFEKLTCFDFAIWGPGWQQLEQSSELRRCLKGSHTTPELWKKIYSAARIVVAPHYQNQENIPEVHQASPRVFEAMACGAFLLTDAQKDVLDLFETGKHLVIYKDADELKDKIRHYLRNPEEREKIAKQGQKEVFSKHTYIQRVEYLLSILQKSAYRI